MTKRERLEDLGRLHYMLRTVIEDEIFEHTDSKHGYEEWVKQNHDKIEYEEPRGLDHIFRKMRYLHDKIQECYYIAMGDDDD